MSPLRESPPSGRRPTMRDVAERARVSFKTVSRVVNEEGGVSPVLERRVRRAIEELDFRPNVGARILRRADRRTASIGLLLEDVVNPYSAAVHRAVEDAATPRGVVVYAASVEEDPARERTLAKLFCARHVDGLVLAPASEDQSYLAADLRSGTAIVCVDRQAQNLPVDSVLTTNAIGATEAVRHLVSGGHRRIAFLGDRRTIVTARQRFEGYLAALDAAGLPMDPSLVAHDLHEATAADGMVTALLGRPDPPTALFTAQNLITIGAVRALRRLGREHTVALVGFDDFVLADLLSPGVTVVAQDVAEIGRTVAERLFARIGGDVGPPETRLVPTRLLRRGSGEIPPPR
jgi:LacI family transcriptional regulator